MYDKYTSLRDEKGFTDYRVAKEAGIPQVTLSDWKAGRYTPKVDKLMKIAEVLGVSVEYFLR